IYEPKDSWNVEAKLPQRLRLLECRSIHFGGVLGRLVHKNRQSLEVIRLGQEKDLVKLYRQKSVQFLSNVMQPLNSPTCLGRLQDIPNLREVALVGLNVGPFAPESVLAALFFCNLERLTLESCIGSEGFLSTLASAFRLALSQQTEHSRSPKLKEFSFRHETPT